MLKKILFPLLALAMLVPFAFPQNVRATAPSDPIVIENVLDLCELSLSRGYWINNEGNCNNYSANQTAATLNRIIYIEDNIVLKNLNLTFTRANAVFHIVGNGSLTIEGGHYTSPNCIVYIQYRNSDLPFYYVPTTMYIINSGVFEATLETAESEDAPSPVCVISMHGMTEEETRVVINNYLPEGHRFVDRGTITRNRNVEEVQGDTEIPIEEGEVHIQKDRRDKDEARYLKTTIVEVVGGEVNDDEQESEQEEDMQEEGEERISEEQEIVNPNTLDTGVSHYVVIFTFSFVVIFTTKYRGEKRNNRLNKH